MTIQATHQDVVASEFRNALFVAIPDFDYFQSGYEQMDAQVLESAYRKTDKMKKDDIETYYQVITSGHELRYNSEEDDFYAI